MLETEMSETEITYTHNDYNYIPNYSDRYIQYLERLTKDKSENNKINVQMTKNTLSGLIIINERHKFIKHCIISQRDTSNSIFRSL